MKIKRYYDKDRYARYGGGGVGLGLAGFTPASLPALRIWTEPEGLNALADNDPISSWTDQSGNGNPFTQGTAGNRPLCKTGILNGFRVARFDGTDDFLESVYAASDESAGEQTFACVFRTTNVTPTQIILWAGDPIGNGFGSEDEFHISIGDGATGGSVNAAVGGGLPLASNLSGFSDVTNFHVMIGRFTQLQGANKTAQIILDTTINTQASGATTNNYATYSGVTLLGKPGAGTRQFTGDIAAVVVCAASLSDTEIASLDTYWSNKFGI